MLVPADLERVITNAYDEGRVRFGELGLNRETYTGRIQLIIRKHLGPSPPSDTAVNFARGLHGRDLYLGTACAQESIAFTSWGIPRISKTDCPAWETFENEFRVFINHLVRFFSGQEFLGRDLADNMLADLFFPDRSGTSRIASYDGRSSLCTWLRVVFCNQAINVRRSPAYFRAQHVENDFPDIPNLVNIDKILCVRSYGRSFADSVALACRELTPEERLLLLWRYEDGLRLQRIAELFGIHPSNVSRRLDRIHNKLRSRVVARLSKEHRISKSAIKECLHDVIESGNHGISILDSIRMSGRASNRDVSF